MRTILKFTPPGPVPSTTRWLDEVVRHEPMPPPGTVDPLDMRTAGCALIRSVIAGAVAELTFEWPTDVGGASDDRDAFVQWWAARPGWKFEITSVDGPPNLGTAAEGESLYGPDVDGRPCSPPPARTLDEDTPGLEGVDGRPCQPPPGGAAHAPAAPSVADSAESTG